MNGAPGGNPGRTVAFRFPEGYRPPVAVDFDVVCEVGSTVVTVDRDLASEIWRILEHLPLLNHGSPAARRAATAAWGS